VAATAICARKRPELFPVLDKAFTDALALPSPEHPYECWHHLRLLLADRKIVRRLERFFARAATQTCGLPLDIYPLRQLYVVCAELHQERFAIC
jgi:hypothetical protein